MHTAGPQGSSDRSWASACGRPGASLGNSLALQLSSLSGGLVGQSCCENRERSRARLTCDAQLGTSGSPHGIAVSISPVRSVAAAWPVALAQGCLTLQSAPGLLTAPAWMQGACLPAHTAARGVPCPHRWEGPSEQVIQGRGRRRPKFLLCTNLGCRPHLTLHICWLSVSSGPAST